MTSRMPRRLMVGGPLLECLVRYRGAASKFMREIVEAGRSQGDGDGLIG
jgi:hypothetical protein